MIFFIYIYNVFNSKKEISIQLGRRIRTLRIGAGKSMVDLAFESGMEYTQLSRIELGQISTSIYQLYKISEALNIEIIDFFY